MAMTNFGSPHHARRQTTKTRLLDALNTFSTNRIGARSIIQSLRVNDPLGLTVAVAQLLGSTEEKPAHWQYIAGLLSAGGLLTGLLMNQQVLSSDKATALAQKLIPIDPRLDVHLVQSLMGNAMDGVASIPAGDILRLLELVDATSDCMSLAPYLVQFLRHPNGKVRSKTALLLGRANFNLQRVETLMTSEDERTRANAIESLWGQTGEKARKILWNATRDTCNRVVVNAVLGLCKAGDHEGYGRLGRIAAACDPVLRSGAAWAMGELGDVRFSEALEKLAQDFDEKVRAMAAKSMDKLKSAAPASQSTPTEESQPDQTSAQRATHNTAGNDDSDDFHGPKTIPVQIG